MSKYNELISGSDQDMLSNMQNFLDAVDDTAVKKAPARPTKPANLPADPKQAATGFIDGPLLAKSKDLPASPEPPPPELPSAEHPLPEQRPPEQPLPEHPSPEHPSTEHLDTQRLATGGRVIDSIDLGKGKSVFDKFSVPTLSIYSHAAFLYFLEQEGLRSVRNKAPLSIVLFSVRVAPNIRQHRQLTLLAVRESIKRVSALKRKTDMLCQYENGQFAVILPETNLAGGKTFAYRVEKSLCSSELVTGLNSTLLSVKLGVAGAGKHCQSLESLLGAAEWAIRESERKTENIVVYDPDSTGQEAAQPPQKMPDLAEMILLANEMHSEEFKIFTYPAMLFCLERELQRAERNRRYLPIILLKICKENLLGGTWPLPKSILEKFIDNIGLNLRRTDAFGFFGDGNFIILACNSSLANMNDLAQKTVDTIIETNMREQLIEPELLNVGTKVVAVRKNSANPILVDLIST